MAISEIESTAIKFLSDLDEFYFRWLENSPIEIGKAATISLMLNHHN